MDAEDQLHAEYNEKMREIADRSRAHPDDWKLFFECVAETDAISAQLDDALAALPKPKRKGKRWKR